MKVKRPISVFTAAFLALFSLAFSGLADWGDSAQASVSSGKKHKRKHKPSYTNMSLVPPPPPSVAIPAGMLLSVPPPPAMAMLPVQFNPYSYQASTPHRCAHCGFSDSTYLAPTQSQPASYFKPFPRRTFYNTDTYTSTLRNRSRKTQSEKQTRKFKRRKCVFAAQ